MHEPQNYISSRRKLKETLSDRDLQIISLIADGKTDQEIGLILHLSAKTINYHVEKLKALYGVRTRIQLAVTAVRLKHIR